MNRPNDAGEYIEVEWRTPPLSGRISVQSQQDGHATKEELLAAIGNSVGDLLRQTPELIAVRFSGEGDWTCPDATAQVPLAVREIEKARLVLSAEQVQQLPAEYTDIAPGDVAYASPLWAIVADDSNWGRVWLEAAVRAGHVPHQEGIELAQQGVFLFTRAHVQQSIDGGVLGDAEGWLSAAQMYRRFATLLNAEADSLDRWRDDLLNADAEVTEAAPSSPDGAQLVPHRPVAHVCSRCRVSWPCRSIVRGHDAEPIAAAEEDWPSEDVRRDLATLAARGLVMDSGLRRGKPPMIVYIAGDVLRDVP